MRTEEKLHGAVKLIPKRVRRRRLNRGELFTAYWAANFYKFMLVV